MILDIKISINIVNFITSLLVRRVHVVQFDDIFRKNDHVIVVQ